MEHRYSDFATLNEQLHAQPSTETGYISKELIPRLTSKKLLKSKSLSAYTVDKRRIKLGKYLNELICLEEALSNRLILSFLGMLNTSRFDVAKSTGNPRNIIHLSKLKTEAKAGDIILFKCANTLSHLQRAVTRSEFDHVGIVINSVKNPGQLDILESTGDGVTAFSLIGRLRAYYHHNFVEYMCIRQLKNFNPTPKIREAADEFVHEVVGLPYGFSASQVFSKKQKSTSLTKRLSSMLVSSTKKAEAAYENSQNSSTNSDEKQNKAFFCSELVAALLKEYEIIPKTLNSEYFWPGSFSKDDEVDSIIRETNCAAYFENEMVIDCRVVEIAKATINPDNLRKKSVLLDNEIVVRHDSTCSDDSSVAYATPPLIKDTEKTNSKNEPNKGLDQYSKLNENLAAKSVSQLEVGSSDEDDDDDNNIGNPEQNGGHECDGDDDEEIMAPKTTFAPSLF